MGQDQKHPIIEDFVSFTLEEGVAPPDALSKKVRRFIHHKLNPRLSQVLGKLAVVSSASGLAVLAICPQFGLTLFAEPGLLKWLVLLGPFPCMFLCGALFLGSGAFFTSLLLSPEEIRKLWSFRYLYFAALALLALTIFSTLGAEIVFSLGLAWFLGALGGEAAGFSLGKQFHLVRG